MVEYVARLKNRTAVRVSIPSSVLHQGTRNTVGQLAPEVAALFVDALAKAGVPITALVEAVPAHHELGQQALVSIEVWDGPLPWPIFVGIGDDCVAEFYPSTFEVPASPSRCEAAP